MLMIGAVLALTSGALAADPIPWADNFESALAQAVETDTPLVVEFVSNGCSRCAKMATKTLAAPEVVERRPGGDVAPHPPNDHGERPRQRPMSVGLEAPTYG